jgi:hypothetical protein
MTASTQSAGEADPRRRSWAILAECPMDAMRWAALAYYLGAIDTRADIAEDFRQAGSHAAAIATSSIWPLPTQTDLVHRRNQPTDSTCGVLSCTGRCSRCIRARAVEVNRTRDGHDDYPGTAA